MKVGRKFGAPVILSVKHVRLHKQYDMQKKLVITGATISMSPARRHSCVMTNVTATVTNNLIIIKFTASK